MLDGLSKADIQEVRKAIVKCQEWGETLARNESCGMDCQEAKREQAMAMDFLTRVNKVHGPQYPAKA